MVENINAGKIDVPDWDDYFMSMAYLVAAKSKDERTHIGAVIIGPDKEIKSTGYNSFVRRLKDNFPKRQQKPEKFFWFEHAERNAIYNATLIGTSLKGCKMYTNGIPCMDCARAVVQSGIDEVIVDKSWNDGNKGDDLEHTRRTLQMFEEVGVKIRYWEGKLLSIEKFRRGEVLNQINTEKNKMKIKIKKLHPDAIIPSYAHPGDAGMDVYAVSKKNNDKFIEYGTGLSFEVPENHVMLVFPRSSVTNKELMLKNSVGVLDSGYRGELFLRFNKFGNETYEVGERVGQIIVIPYPRVEFEETSELSDTSRGDGGFGSTGLQ